MKVNIIYENTSIKFFLNKDIYVKDLLKSLKNIQSQNQAQSQSQSQNQNQNNLTNLNFKNKEFQLLDKNHKLLQLDEYISIKKYTENNFNISLSNNDIKSEKTENEILLYLVPFDTYCTKKYESVEEFHAGPSGEKSANKKTDISELLMKVTNAKEKVSLKAKGHTHDRMRIFDFINSNIGNLANDSSQVGNSSNHTHLNELLNILRPMIENDGEVGFNSISNIPRRVSRPQVTVTPDENLVNNLKEMGFPEDQCRRALVASRNDISRATDLLLSDSLDYMPNEK